ncbi:hypothetical protein G3341_17465 [Providencia vermicola]|uniref:hypothetical protein n=1 Tax=Providencia vermicola TaxID=333965 RepID=UPI0013A7293E|nr:hypothetical protein [Providencia vermicola]QIC17357.1 hypothetical protein G3341_17465 [Providencia vermicola]
MHINTDDFTAEYIRYQIQLKLAPLKDRITHQIDRFPVIPAKQPPASTVLVLVPVPVPIPVPDSDSDSD